MLSFFIKPSVDSEYDSGALTIGYEYDTAWNNIEVGASYDLLSLTYENQIDGDRFFNIYSKYNLKLSRRSWWIWASLGYNVPLSDLANTEIWYEAWEGLYCFSFGIESERGLGFGFFYNYANLTGYSGALYDQMVYRSSIYYSF